MGRKANGNFIRALSSARDREADALTPFKLKHPQRLEHKGQNTEMATNGVTMASPSAKPISLSFPMPKALETRIHMHLTIQTTSLLLFLTTTLNGNTSEAAPLGSFVYALPDVCYSSPSPTPIDSKEGDVQC
jgi:hypothetical protein